MNNHWKRFLQVLFLFQLSGIVYVFIELLYRGYSHITMFFCAGLCGLFLAYLNDFFSYDMDFRCQVLISTVFCTFTEWIFGLIFNTDYSIWDYRDLPFNLTPDSQVNLIFCMAWALIATFGIPLLDFIEWKFFDYMPNEKPYYKIHGNTIHLY